MREIEKKMVSHFWAGEEARQKNDEVVTSVTGARDNTGRMITVDAVFYLLHGNMIAWRVPETGDFKITMAGWGSKTTRSRLTAILSQYSNPYRFYLAQSNHAQVLGVRGPDGKVQEYPIDTDEIINLGKFNQWLINRIVA